MSYEANAVDDALKISGTVLKMTAFLSYEGARFFVEMMERIISNAKHDENYKKFTDMVSSNRDAVVFPLFKKYERTFINEARRMGITYCILKDKKEKCEVYPLLVKREEADAVNRMFERLKLYEFDENLENPMLREALEEKASEGDCMVKEEELKIRTEKEEIMKPNIETKLSGNPAFDEKDDYAFSVENPDRESIRARILAIRKRREEVFAEVSRLEREREAVR